jgi:hypothetical protein
MRRIIDANGQIKLIPNTNDNPREGEDKGFRKGLKALRDIKMHWTCMFIFLRVCVCVCLFNLF